MNVTLHVRFSDKGTRDTENSTRIFACKRDKGSGDGKAVVFVPIEQTRWSSGSIAGCDPASRSRNEHLCASTNISEPTDCVLMRKAYASRRVACTYAGVHAVAFVKVALVAPENCRRERQQTSAIATLLVVQCASVTLTEVEERWESLGGSGHEWGKTEKQRKGLAP